MRTKTERGRSVSAFRIFLICSFYTLPLCAFGSGDVLGVFPVGSVKNDLWEREVGAMFALVAAPAPHVLAQGSSVSRVGFLQKSTEAVFSFFAPLMRAGVSLTRALERAWHDGSVFSPAAVLGIKINAVTERDPYIFPSLAPDENKLSPAGSLGNIKEEEHKDAVVRTTARVKPNPANAPLSQKATEHAVTHKEGIKNNGVFRENGALKVEKDMSAVPASEGGVSASASTTPERVQALPAVTVKDRGQTPPLGVPPGHQPDIFTLIPIGAPGFGGGGKPAVSRDAAAPLPPVVLSPSDFSHPFATTTILFSGSGEEGATVLVAYRYSNATTTAGATVVGGVWSFPRLLFGQGTTTVEFSATLGSGATSATTTVLVRVNTTPLPPVILSPNGSPIVFATSTVTFSGTASSTQIIATDFSAATTTAGNSGAWSLTISGFPQATTTLHFFARNADGLVSSPVALSVNVDTQAPTVSPFSILECEHSLSVSVCLSGSGTLHLSWGTSATDVSLYAITKDGAVFATTTAATSTILLLDGAYTLAVGAVDYVGNAATSTALSVVIASSPVVINEIAWAGTPASSSDEWVELYNRTGYAIDLSHATLVASDTVPYIRLGNTIGAGGYYLIERSSSTTTSVSEDLVAAFSGLGSGSGLSNSGEALFLFQALGSEATTTLDRTPELADCSGGHWCAGSAGPDFLSMERKDAAVAGSATSNWASNNKVIKNGNDARGGALNGTPKAKNSVSQ